VELEADRVQQVAVLQVEGQRAGPQQLQQMAHLQTQVAQLQAQVAELQEEHSYWQKRAGHWQHKCEAQELKPAPAAVDLQQKVEELQKSVREMLVRHWAAHDTTGVWERIQHEKSLMTGPFVWHAHPEQWHAD